MLDFGNLDFSFVTRINAPATRTEKKEPKRCDAKAAAKPQLKRGFDLKAVKGILRSETSKRQQSRGPGQAMLAAAEFVVGIVLRDHRNNKEFRDMMDTIHRFVASAYTRRPDTDEDAARDLADEWMEKADHAIRPLTAEEIKAQFAPKTASATPPPARKSDAPKARQSDPPKATSSARVARKSPDKRLVQVYIEDGHLSYLDAYVVALEAEPIIAAHERREQSLAQAERAKQERIARQQAQEAKRASASYGAMTRVPQPKKDEKKNGGKDGKNKKAERAAAHA